MTTRDFIMSAAGASAPAAPEDTNFKNVSLLLQGDGTNGAQNNTFVDSSSNNFTITRNGNTTQGTFSPYGNLWSNYFDGDVDSFTIANATALDLSSGAWTIECFAFYTGGSSYRTICSKRGGSTSEYELGIDGSGYFYFYTSSIYTSSQPVSANSWNHLAASYDGTNLRLFINGTVVLTQAGVTAASGSSSLNISKAYSTYQYFTGYISNLRIVKGRAVYTGNFTPSTVPLGVNSGGTNPPQGTETSLLTCQSNRFIDNSSNNFAITVNGNTSVQRFSPFNPTAAYSAATIGGSGYFDGTGDYLTTPSNAAFAYGTGDFTWEMWIYPTASNWAYYNFYLLDHGSNNGVIQYYNNVIRYYNPTTGESSPLYTSGGSVTPYQWTHIAISRSSGTTRLFVNGSLRTSGSDSHNYGTQSVTVANYGGGGAEFFGYISQVRLVKGTAVYTGNFTPPTLAPLAATGATSAACYPSTTNVNTSFTNTSLLCNFTNAGVWDAAMMNDLETVGNAQVSTSVKKYGTGSLYFDGTGDYLTGPVNIPLSFGTGNFTVEAWVYITATKNANPILDTLPLNGTGHRANSIAFAATNGSNKPQIFSNGVSYEATSAISLNTWVHLAFVREGTGTNQTKIYINGENKGSFTVATNDTLGGINIGVTSDVPSDNTYMLQGYIDDLRITKGLARYTANFTPPTAALPLY